MRFVALALMAALAGCSAAQTTRTATSVTTSLSSAQADLTEAMKLYGIGKGIAQVAIAADPALGTTLTPSLMALDALFATAQVALADTATTAPAIEALAAQIKSQTTAVISTAAPAVKVVAGH